MTITFSVTNDLSALSGGNQPLSKIDTNFADIVTALSGQVMSQAEIVALIASSGAMPRSYLAGLGLANNVSDATNDIDIAVGAARNSTNTADLVLAAALTKRLDATWVVGNNQGWRDTGTIGNFTYHAYLIERSDTGNVDALASLNNDNSGTITVTIASPGVVTWANHGLQIGSSLVFSTTGALPTGITAGTRYWVITAGFGAGTFRFSTSEGGAAVNTSGSQSGVHTGTASPVMPTSYDLRRYMGSFIRSGGAIVLFIQRGDRFDLSVPVNTFADNNPGTSALTKVLTNIPIGVSVEAILAVNIKQGGTVVTTYGLVTPLDLADTVPTSLVFNFGTDVINVAGATIASTTWMETATDRAAQVRVRLSFSDGSTDQRATVHGWINRRGRDV